MVRVNYGLNGMEAEDMNFTFESKISAMAYSPITNKSTWLPAFPEKSLLVV